MKRKICLALALCAVVGWVGLAEDAIMTNTVTKTVSWTNLVNWTDSSGAPLTEIPTGATVNVSFPNAPVGISRQTEKMDVFINTTDDRNSTALNVVSDAPNAEGEDWSRRLILLDNRASTVSDYPARLTIGNPDGFHGYWSFSRSLGCLILPATGAYTPKLSNLSAKARPTVEVAEAKARLGSVFENGAVRKTGAGELEVGETTGAGTRFYVSEGTLTLNGAATHPSVEPEEGDDLPVPGAALHLDATVGATLVTTNETEHETGLTFVTKWSDVRGNGLYAYHDGKAITSGGAIPFANAPFLNTTDASGRTFVDFGSALASQKTDGYGPTNCLLRLSQKLTGCREIFLVASKIAAGSNTSPLGDGDSAVYPFHPGGANALVSDANYASVEPVREGFILLNGEVTGNEVSWPSHLSPTETQLAVASFGTTNGVTLSLVGTDRYLHGRAGGWRLGEVVIYTNVLTTAERYAVHRHLQTKWQGVDAASIGSVVLSSGASVGVPAGRTAKVAELTAIDGTLVKTGAGVLEVGAFSGKTDETVKTLDVRGGSVKIAGLPAVSATKPADGALLWLDANAKSSFVFTNDTGAVDYVGEWHDCRPEQTTVWARLPKDPGGASSEGKDLVKGDGDVPTRIENVVNGLAVVDFGEYKAPKTGGNSFMVVNTPGYSTANAREAFLVQESSSTARSAIFGYGTGVSMIRSGSTSLLNDTSYGSHLGRNAVMTLNGVQIDPCMPGQAALTTGTFDVYSVSAQALLPLTLIGGKDRIGQSSSFGGCQVGELILYDRKLTLAERRQTIAYLMKKWQNKTPQFATALEAIGTTFADDIPATFDVADDLEVTSIKGSNGSIVKRGAGTVTLPETTATSAGAIEVEEGTLVTDFHVEPEIPQPLFRYDASEPSSFTGKYVGEDGETRVTSLANLGSWSRTLSSSKGNGGAVTNPAVEMVEMRQGVSRPCFNFGYRGGTLASGNGATAFHGSSTGKSVAEYYAIVADNVASTSPSYQNLFSNIGSPVVYFKRGTDGKLLAADANEKVRNGYIAVDGVETAYTEALPTGFHLFTAVPTEALSIGYICMARETGSNTGGLKMSEMIIYDQANTPAHRDYLQQKLMHKWFDTPMPTWDFSIESVSVAEGATWRDTAEYMKLFAGEATLAGAVEVEDLSVSTALTLGGAAEDTGDLTLADGIAISLAAADASLAVSGTLTFSGAATVTLEDPAFAKIAAGEYTVFAATEIVGFDPHAVTLDTSALATRKSFSFVTVTDGETGKMTAVKLRVMNPGMLLIVR